MYLQGQNQFLNSENDDKPLMGDVGGQVDPTLQQTYSGADQGGVDIVNPGSVGSSARGASQAGIPAWTNIQAYLNAAPEKSGVVQAFETQADQTASKARQDIDQFRQNTLDPYEDIKGAYDATTFAPNKILSAQRTQMSGKPTGQEVWDTTGNVSQLFNTDFDLNFEPLQQSEQFKELQGTIDDPNQFVDYIGNQYDDFAGRQLTPGEFDLQRQIDLSRGTLGQARDAALNRMSGLADEYSQVNEGLENKYNQFQAMGQQARNFQNQLQGSSDLYLRKLAENRWDPTAQRQGEQAFYQGAVKPARDELTNIFDRILQSEYHGGSNPDWQADHQTILNARPDLRNAYEGIMSGDYGNNADQFNNWILEMASRPGMNQLTGGLKNAYNSWIGDNQQLYRDTFF